MRTPTRWLAVLAVCGVSGGGAIALVQGRPVQATASVVTVPGGAGSAPQAPSATRLTVQLLIDQANQLQRAISGARAALATSSRTSVGPSAAGSSAGTTAASSSSTTVAGASAQSGQSQQLAVQQSALDAERQQLAAQAQTMATESQQLAAEQAQLEQEAQQLAASQSAATTTTAPTARRTDD